MVGFESATVGGRTASFGMCKFDLIFTWDIQTLRCPKSLTGLQRFIAGDSRITFVLNSDGEGPQN